MISSFAELGQGPSAFRTQSLHLWNGLLTSLLKEAVGKIKGQHTQGEATSSIKRDAGGFIVTGLKFTLGKTFRAVSGD